MRMQSIYLKVRSNGMDCVNMCKDGRSMGFVLGLPHLIWEANFVSVFRYLSNELFLLKVRYCKKKFDQFDGDRECEPLMCMWVVKQS